MKRLVKTVAGLLAAGGIAAVLMTAAPNQADAYEAEYGVKVQINDALVAFSEAGPFIDSTGTLQVPIRQVAEKMGYNVSYAMQDEQVSVTLNDGKSTISLKTGTQAAKLSEKAIKLTAAPLFQNSTTYVPLRFVTESFGYIVQWDDENGVAIICQDGQYHAPAWYVPPKKTTADWIADTAQQYIGIRYMYGGTTPSGFDCSGFVNYVFDKYGIDLPRTSRGMYDTVGARTVGLEKGDLVFFTIGKSTTHVGIYLGDQLFISSTSSGGIKIDSIVDSYWGPKFIGAKRVL
ncbi:C40 family peptidase [Paenibacillus koleovorans]|uniref:C40 family peptidase n=1 Tax=Paenibacillus koleovorans TaxID=121608 RepID=UPI001FEC6971|nr:NlpC/P60 family protein [Paenibacillus koleovorans]